MKDLVPQCMNKNKTLKMSNLTLPLSFFLLFLLHSCTAATVNPLFHICFNKQNYTGPYGSNLNRLTTTLMKKTPSTGFSSGSTGQTPNRVYGLALCRGDVSATSCKSCMTKAAKAIKSQCPKDKGAIIWYDNCLFKYSNKNFIGQVDLANRFYIWNRFNVSNPTRFNSQTRSLISGLADRASSISKKYATGTLTLTGSEKIYGLVQCTRDITKGECKSCLDSIISEIPKCCNGKKGGRVVGGSCNFRYELYPFYKS